MGSVGCRQLRFAIQLGVQMQVLDLLVVWRRPIRRLHKIGLGVNAGHRMPGRIWGERLGSWSLHWSVWIDSTLSGVGLSDELLQEFDLFADIVGDVTGGVAELLEVQLRLGRCGFSAADFVHDVDGLLQFGIHRWQG